MPTTTADLDAPVSVAEAAEMSRDLVRSLGMQTLRLRVEAAEQYQHLDDLRVVTEQATGASWQDPDDLAWRDLRAEVAAALGVHERTAHARLETARRLVHDFPRTHVGLWAGRFSDAHAQALVEHSRGLATEHWEEYESLLLPAAAEMALSRFRRLADQVRASLQPEALIERHRLALEERRVCLEAAPDGMAWIMALLSAEDAIGAAAAVSGLARHLIPSGDSRTSAQIEADVFRDLLTDGTGAVPPSVAGEQPQPSPAAQRGVRAHVTVHVPVLTAMGASDDPGRLEGYGPIDAETARVLCAGAPSFLRVLTDPEAGAVLSYGRRTYRVPADLKRVLQARDETCRFIGCTRPASLCDIDHSVPWSEGGETVVENLAHLCRGHHRLKERGRWRLGHDPDATLRWTSPAGVTYTSKRPNTGFPRAGSKIRAMTDWVPPPF